MKRKKSDQDGVYNGNSAMLLYFSTMIMQIVGALSRYTDMAEMLDAVVTARLFILSKRQCLALFSAFV